MINIALSLMVAGILLNVWLFRHSRQTPYRGGDALTIKDEFLAYGLSLKTMYIVGSLKICAAIALVIGIWLPQFVFPAATVISLLMFSAILMHVKIRDPLIKTTPAFFVLVMSVALMGRSSPIF